MTARDGWPIHPIPEIRDQDGCGIMEGWNGMSLRDHFAGQALVAIGENTLEAGRQERIPAAKAAEGLAVACYHIADAMLAARSRTGGDA